MNNEYIIVNKTALLKMREGLICVRDYQIGQMDLIDAIISSQSTPLIPEIEKAFVAGDNYRYYENNGSISIPSHVIDEEEYIANLKLDI